MDELDETDLNGDEASDPDEPNASESIDERSAAPVVKKKRTSKTRPFSNPIHKWFGDDGAGNSKCSNCPEVLKGRHATNLKNHLKARHPKDYEEFLIFSKDAAESIKKRPAATSKPDNCSQSIVDCFRQLSEQKDGLKRGSNAYEKAIRSIAIGFAANSLPYQLIEDPHVKYMFAVVSNGRVIDLPHRRELAERIRKLTAELKTSVKELLESAKYVSLTVDLWSRPGYSSSMIGVTCHFFDRKLDRIARVLLSCRPIGQPHTGARIFEVYDVIRNEWAIDQGRILRIVTDNGSNIVKAFKDCLLLLAEQKAQQGNFPAESCVDPNLDDSFVENEMEDGEIAEFEHEEDDMDAHFASRKQRISCVAHNMMLAVRKAVDHSCQVREAKKKVHHLIAEVSNSPKATEMLKQRTGGIGIIKPVTTRWIYWFYVFDRLLKLKRQLCEVCDELNIIHDLNPMDWKLVAEVTRILKPFAQAVTRLEGEAYATVSEVYPILFSLKANLNQFELQGGLGSILRLVEKLSYELDFRFKQVLCPRHTNFDPVYVVGTLLDHRYTLLLEGELLDIAKNELKLMIAGSKTSFHHENHHSVSDDPNLLTEEPAHSTDLLAAALSKINERRRSASLDTPVVNSVDLELEIFFSDVKTLVMSVADDPFAFWSERKDKLPQLFDVAIDILTIPATSAPSERIFSRASCILGKNRHRLSDDNLEAELFYKVNLEFFQEFLR